MHKLTDPFAYTQLTMERLKKGILLVSVDDAGKPNVMAASWGFLGYQWNAPVFVTPVRTERYTHSLISKEQEFVISVQPAAMDEDMTYCGTHSGRSVDKFKERGLVPVEIPGFKTPGVKGSLLHYACRVVHAASAEPLTSHTFFFGEVMGAYTENIEQLAQKGE